MIEMAHQFAGKWGIGEIQGVVPISAGTACQSFMITSASGKYILRGFSSLRQATQEAYVSQVLAGTGMAATVLPANQGTFYVFHNGNYFNLQTFLSGVKPDFSNKQQLLAAIEATAKIHRTVSICSYPFSDYDRFSTLHLLRQVKGMAFPAGLFPENLTALEDRENFISRLELQLSKSQIIHGDLGPWNMLWNNGTVQIIDFGECRLGDIHFDLAAFICSMLSKCGSQKQFTNNMMQILDIYEKTASPVDNRKLHISIYLWLLRGALASAIHIGDHAARERRLQHFVSEIKRYEAYTGKAITSNEGIISLFA